MSRPVGSRLREVCNIVEQLGRCRPIQIAKYTNCSPEAVRVYCTRGFDKGLLTREGCEYRTVPGWRQILNEPVPAVRIVPEYVPRRHVLDSWLTAAVALTAN